MLKKVSPDGSLCDRIVEAKSDEYNVNKERRKGTKRERIQA